MHSHYVTCGGKSTGERRSPLNLNQVVVAEVINSAYTMCNAARKFPNFQIPHIPLSLRVSVISTSHTPSLSENPRFEHPSLADISRYRRGWRTYDVGSTSLCKNGNYPIEAPRLLESSLHAFGLDLIIKHSVILSTKSGRNLHGDIKNFLPVPKASVGSKNANLYLQRYLVLYLLRANLVSI